MIAMDKKYTVFHGAAEIGICISTPTSISKNKVLELVLSQDYESVGKKKNFDTKEDAVAYLDSVSKNLRTFVCPAFACKVIIADFALLACDGELIEMKCSAYERGEC